MTRYRAALFLRQAEILGSLPLAWDETTREQMLAAWREIEEQVAFEVIAIRSEAAK